jgi:hypothetical protein
MNRQRPLRLLALMAAVCLALAGIACGDDEGEGAGSGDTAAENGSKELTLNGKSTTLTLDEGVVSVLEKKKVHVTPVEPAGPDDGGGVRFPITGGTVNSKTLAGTIAHSGGLRFSVAGETLQVTDFVADTEAGVLTATAGAAELPLLALDFTRLKKSKEGGAIVASKIATTLTPYAAAAMNGILGVKFFKEGLALGELTVTATGS